MREDDLRRLILNVNTSLLLSGQADPSQRDVNRAVQLARGIDKAVRKRLRWEESRRSDGSDEMEVHDDL